MLAFIDESGDTGLKLDRYSSPFFSVALVIFEDHEEAIGCDQRITLLRKELDLPEDFEFHFKENSDRIRKLFLEAVAKYNFLYFGFALNKDPKKLWGPGFQHKGSLYKYTCNLVFENAKPHLNNAIVIIDKSGTDTFRSQLAKYLGKIRTNDGKCLIKKVKMQNSRGTNLLQLADYVVGVINRKVQQKKKFQEYADLIAMREMDLRIWPK